MEHLDVGGLRIAFQRRGHGPCLLLLHGAVSDSRVWRAQLESLSDAFTVVAWDAPGCGGSSDPPDHFRLPEYAECLSRFIDALGLQRPHVLGHSWGRPSLWSCIGSVRRRSGACCWSAPTPAGPVRSHRTKSSSGSSLRCESLTCRRVHSNRRRCRGCSRTRCPPLRPTIWRESCLTFGPRQLGRWHTRSPRRTCAMFFRTSRRRRCSLYGDADERVPLSVARALHERIPRSTLAVMPGLGHECYLESAEAFETACP